MFRTRKSQEVERQVMNKILNPLENKDPDITLDIEDREIGGLGIFLVKKTMDELSYEYVDGQNILTMKKELA